MHSTKVKETAEAKSVEQEMMDEAVNILKRYFVYATDYGAETSVLFAVMTHLFEEMAEFNTHLAYIAPMEGSGKTTHAIASGALSRAAWITGNASVASLRKRNLDKGTLVLDEADTFMTGPEFTNFLNISWMRETAFQERCVETKKGWEPEEFSVWCPIIFARVGNIEEATTRSRCILIRMRKAGRNEIERFDRAAKAHVRKLGQRLGKILQSKSLRESISNVVHTVVIPEQLDWRTADNWRLLIAIADVVRVHWPETARKAAIALSGVREPSPYEQIIELVHDLPNVVPNVLSKSNDGYDCISSEELLVECRTGGIFSYADAIPSRLNGILSAAGIYPKRKRFKQKQRRVYVLADFPPCPEMKGE